MLAQKIDCFLILKIPPALLPTINRPNEQSSHMIKALSLPLRLALAERAQIYPEHSPLDTSVPLRRLNAAVAPTRIHTCPFVRRVGLENRVFRRWRVRRFLFAHARLLVFVCSCLCIRSCERFIHPSIIVSIVAPHKPRRKLPSTTSQIYINSRTNWIKHLVRVLCCAECSVRVHAEHSEQISGPAESVRLINAQRMLTLPSTHAV